jgi:hypothetical protein
MLDIIIFLVIVGGLAGLLIYAFIWLTDWLDFETGDELQANSEFANIVIRFLDNLDPSTVSLFRGINVYIGLRQVKFTLHPRKGLRISEPKLIAFPKEWQPELKEKYLRVLTRVEEYRRNQTLEELTDIKNLLESSEQDTSGNNLKLSK